MGFQFQYGVGYKLASGEKQSATIRGIETNTLPQDYIDVDCIYTPIRKVNFEIENVYNEDNSLNERLILEICTDGSIEPIYALKKSCEIIRDIFNSLIKVKENINSNELFDSTLDIESRKSPSSIIKLFSDQGTFIKSKKQKTLVEQYRNIPIEELDLSVRPYNCLRRQSSRFAKLCHPDIITLVIDAPIVSSGSVPCRFPESMPCHKDTFYMILT